MLRLVLFVGVVLTISAQPPADASTQTEQAPEFSLDQSIFAQVQAERLLSKRYIDLVLRTQRAQYNSMAGSIIFKKFLKSQKSESSLEDSLFSTQTLFPTANPEDEDDDPQADAKADLLAAYYLLSAIDIQSIQIIIEASEIQEQFYLDRKLSLAVQMMGSAVPQQLVQFVSQKQLSTYLKTLKLSYALQTVSHWRMWLEDELDVNTVRVTNPGNVAIITEQKEPIIRDRLFAFSSYQTYAQIDVQIFLLDLFLAQSISQFGDSSLGSLGSSSFLEVQSQFIPFMVHQQNPQLYSVMYKYYSLLYQFYAAQSGFAAAQLDSAALKEEDLEKATKQIDEARKLHEGGFAQSLLTGAQLEYMDAIFQVSSLFGGAAGSFGSLGGSFAPQPHYEQTAPSTPPVQEPYVKQ